MPVVGMTGCVGSGENTMNSFASVMAMAAVSSLTWVFQARAGDSTLPVDPTDPVIPRTDYTKVLFYCGPGKTVRVPQGPGSESFKAIVDGYSMTYFDHFRGKSKSPRGHGVKLVPSTNSGEALKAEAAKSGVGFILQLCVEDFRYTDKEAAYHFSHQMLMIRDGKWEELFQGRVIQDKGTGFTAKHELKAVIPTLNEACLPSVLFREALSKRVAVTPQPDAVDTNGPAASRQSRYGLKVHSELPFALGPVVVLAREANAADPVRISIGGLSNIIGAYEEKTIFITDKYKSGYSFSVEGNPLGDEPAEATPRTGHGARDPGRTMRGGR
jgi:hypothetical protein